MSGPRHCEIESRYTRVGRCWSRSIDRALCRLGEQPADSEKDGSNKLVII